MMTRVELTEALRLVPPIDEEAARAIAQRLPHKFRHPLEQFWGSVRRAMAVYVSLPRGVTSIWTQHASLSTRSKRRKAALLIAAQFREQGQALDRAARRLQDLRDLAAQAAPQPQEGGRKPEGEETDEDRLAVALTAVLALLQGVLDQARLSRAAALRDNSL